MIAVLEFTILNRYHPVPLRSFWWWRLVFFGIPALAFIAYSVFYLAV